MLPAALGRHVGDGALEDLEQRLLDTLARDVAGDRRVVRLARDLVDLVDVDDPALRPGDVEVRRLDQPQQDVLDVLPDVAGLGQRGRVGDAEGHVEHARERLREKGLARAGGPDEHHVRLLQLDLVHGVTRVDPLVVVVHGHREDLLGLLLADHVLVERVFDLARVGQLRGSRLRLRLIEHLLFDDLLAEVDALVADVDALARDQLADLLLALAAERAAIRDLGALAPARGAQPIPSPAGLRPARRIRRVRTSTSSALARGSAPALSLRPAPSRWSPRRRPVRHRGPQRSMRILRGCRPRR